MSQSTSILEQKPIILSSFLFAILLGFSQYGFGQKFVSKQNGGWQHASTWNSSGACGQWDNNSVGFPPSSKDWGCAVEVEIGHDVEFAGNVSNFGAGVVAGVKVKTGGKLTFLNDITINGGGSVPYLVVEPGAELHVEGKFQIDRAVKLVIPSGSKLVVNNFVIGDNSPEITISGGGELIVHNTTTLNSRSILNLEGKFVTKDLLFSSGGTINATGLATINVSNDLTVTNGALNLEQDGKVVVSGKVNVGQSGRINLTQQASATFRGHVTIPNGASVTLDNNSNFVFEDNLDMSGGGNLTLRANTLGVIQGEVYLPNGKIETNNASEIFVEGRLLASNGGEVIVKDTSKFSICDYPNSTQLGAYHIKMEQSGFYGAGCINPMPVIWEYVKGEYMAHKSTVVLNWGTTKEWENSHFVLERSVSGKDGFEEIGDVVAIGWSDLPSSYEFQDNDLPAVKGLVYYRVKQVDLNGSFEYSEVVSVTVDNIKNTAFKWVAYPNPTNGDGFNLKAVGGSKVSGKTISARVISLPYSKSVQAEDAETLGLLLAEEIRMAPKGLCVIEIRMDSYVEHIKVLRR